MDNTESTLSVCLFALSVETKLFVLIFCCDFLYCLVVFNSPPLGGGVLPPINNTNMLPVPFSSKNFPLPHNLQGFFLYFFSLCFILFNYCFVFITYILIFGLSFLFYYYIFIYFFVIFLLICFFFTFYRYS